MINEDEDKFMITLEQRQKDGDGLISSNLDKQALKQKKREAKKDLDFYDHLDVSSLEQINKDLYIESREIT